MEKEGLVIETKLLHPMLIGEGALKITEIIQDSMIKNLFIGLSQKQKDILMYQHFYNPDPHGYGIGKNVSLIRLLLIEAKVSPGYILLPQCFNVELFMYNLKKFTGIHGFTALEKEIKEINEIWGNHGSLGRTANIQVEARDSSVPRAKKGDKQYFLKFELL